MVLSIPATVLFCLPKSRIFVNRVIIYIEVSFSAPASGETKTVPHQSKKTNQSGFTLIEVVLTIVLIVATLIIYQATTKTVVVNRWNGYKELALRSADNKIQSLRTTPFATLPASGTFSDSLITSIPDGAGAITVTALNATTKAITVTVSWSDPSNTDTQQVRLDTYISQGGLGQ